MNWIKNKNDGYGCERLFLNRIPVAGYSHTLIRNDPDGDYRGYIDLPVAKNNKIHGTREEVKQRIERLVNLWIEEIKEK